MKIMMTTSEFIMSVVMIMMERAEVAEEDLIQVIVLALDTLIIIISPGLHSQYLHLYFRYSQLFFVAMLVLSMDHNMLKSTTVMRMMIILMLRR